MNYPTIDIQTALRARGFLGKNGKPLVLDGLKGENTDYAIVAFKKTLGYRARPFVGVLTWTALVENAPSLSLTPPTRAEVPPWVAEMLTMMGKHEKRDYEEVKEWLDEDGIKLGDQTRIPWCGAGVSSALNNSGFTAGHPDNPNAAIRWNGYGLSVTPRVGAIMVQHRGDPTDWRGHIGFYMGESASHNYLLGANQGDSVNVTPFPKRLLRKDGSRWPKEGPSPDLYGKKTMSGGKTTKVT